MEIPFSYGYYVAVKGKIWFGSVEIIIIFAAAPSSSVKKVWLETLIRKTIQLFKSSITVTVIKTSILWCIKLHAVFLLLNIPGSIYSLSNTYQLNSNTWFHLNSYSIQSPIPSCIHTYTNTWFHRYLLRYLLYPLFDLYNTVPIPTTTSHFTIAESITVHTQFLKQI